MSIRDSLKKCGPGIIVAATGLGAGDIVAASVAGAQFGTALLWAVLVGAILKFSLTEGLARWQLVTGTTLLEGWIEHLPRALSWYFLIYLILWTFMVSAALMAAVGLAAHAIVPSVSVAVWGIVHSIAALLIVLFGGYRFLETMMKVFIGFMFVCIIICAIAVMPPWQEVLSGLFIPSFPQSSLILIAGVIGGVGGSVTIMSYGYWMREAGWTQVSSLSDMRVDLFVAYGLTALFGIAIVLVAAGVQSDIVAGNDMALVIAERLESVLGETGKWIFLLGFWGAVFSSMIGVWHGVPYLFANFVAHFGEQTHILESESSISSSVHYRGYLVYLSFLPMSLLALDRPVWVVIIYSITGAFFMPLVAVLLLYMNSARKWLGEYINKSASKIVLTICLLLFGTLLMLQVQSRLFAG